ncbi:MAG: hypothetical protein AAF311_16915 [Pseudomonadota bacterium]
MRFLNFIQKKDKNIQWRLFAGSFLTSPTISKLTETWPRQARIDALKNPIHRAYYRFLLFTGLRRSEAARLRWEDLHPDHLHLPMTKNGRPFDLPVLARHHEIVAPLRDLGREWVFPSPGVENKPLRTPGRLDWPPPAHRRTFATVAVEAGLLEEVVGRLLNHTPLSVT